MTDWNPASIAADIRDVSDRLESSSGIIAVAYEAFLKAKREYTIALATKRQTSERSSFNDRNDEAVVACRDLWIAQDTADVAYKYSRDLAEALEKKLSALQTEAKLIMQSYGVAGI